MALRRPPTRVELKADDIDQYEELMTERMMAAADTSQQAAATTPANNNAANNRQAAKDAKKASANERIGVNSRRR